MYKIVLSNAVKQKMTDDQIYFLIQNMMISNSVKMYLLMAERVKGDGLNDELTAKLYIELLFSQASSIYEIIYLNKKELLGITKEILSSSLSEKIEVIVNTEISASDPYLNILKEIRNQHSFHIGREKMIIRADIEEYRAQEDSIIGVAKSNREKDFIYTTDLFFITSYLGKKFGFEKEKRFDIHKMINDAIFKYANIILDISIDVFSEICKDGFEIEKIDT